MIRLVFLLRDTATENYLVPMFFQSEGEARRSVGDVVNRPSDDNAIYNHPEHFQLFYAGTYDDNTGIITGCPPEYVCSASDFVRQKPLT